MAEATKAAGLRGFCAATVMDLPVPGLEERRRGPARRRGLPEEVVGRPADRARRRAARRLHGRAPRRCCAPRRWPTATRRRSRSTPPRARARWRWSRRSTGRPPSPTSTGSASWARTSRSPTRSGSRDDEIATLAARGVGTAHCPSSNMKLASGVSPVPKLRKAGVRGRARHRRPREQQRPEPVRGDRPRAEAAQDHERRPGGAERARRGRDGHDRGGASAPHREGDRLARAGQARRPDRARERLALGAAALRRLLAPRLRAQGLGRGHDHRERPRADGGRPHADARHRAIAARAREYRAQIAARLPAR